MSDRVVIPLPQRATPHIVPAPGMSSGEEATSATHRRRGPTVTEAPNRVLLAELWRRFDRSRLAAELREWAWLIGLLAGAVAAMAIADHLHLIPSGVIR